MPGAKLPFKCRILLSEVIPTVRCLEHSELCWCELRERLPACIPSAFSSRCFGFRKAPREAFIIVPTSSSFIRCAISNDSVSVFHQWGMFLVFARVSQLGASAKLLSRNAQPKGSLNDMFGESSMSDTLSFVGKRPLYAVQEFAQFSSHGDQRSPSSYAERGSLMRTNAFWKTLYTLSAHVCDHYKEPWNILGARPLLLSTLPLITSKEVPVVW